MAMTRENRNQAGTARAIAASAAGARRRILMLVAGLALAAAWTAAEAQPVANVQATARAKAAAKKPAARSRASTARRSSKARPARRARRASRARTSFKARELANFGGLRGSRPKVQAAFYEASARGIPFFADMDDARAAIAAGKFVPLYGNLYYATYRMTLAYATPEARSFIEALAPQFVEKCDEMMVVTSALRPKSRSPRNGSPWTVHPAGIAVDIRKPRNRACWTWLRQTLVDYQNRGIVDATEEFSPPHFHIVVKKAPPAPERTVTTSNGDVIAVVK